MISKTATIQNHAGIHCRPSAVIIKEAAAYAGTITVTSKYGTCDLRSVLDLISLGLDFGAEVSITCDGPDEEQYCERLVTLFEKRYDFPPAS